MEYWAMVEKLKADGVTLKQIGKELNYRNNAAPGCRWDDNLYQYTTEELEQIEQDMLETESY